MPRYLYLDQKDWIDIAKVRARKADASGLRSSAEELVRLIACGELRVPISQSHVLETWKITDSRQRSELADAMIPLSRRAAMAPLSRVWESEFDSLFSSDNSVEEPFGTGLQFALGLEAASISLWPDDASEVLKALTEREILAGSRADVVEPDDQERLADAQGWARWLDARSRDLVRMCGSLRDDSDRIAWFVLNMFGHEPIHRAIGLNAVDDFLGSLREPGGPWSLVQRMPSLATLAELVRLRYPNLDQKWRATDIHDLRALAVALPYCDAVLTDNAWASLIRRSEYIDSLGTVVASGQFALTKALAALPT